MSVRGWKGKAPCDNCGEDRFYTLRGSEITVCVECGARHEEPYEVPLDYNDA